MNIRKISIGLILLILALVIVQGASAAHPMKPAPTSNTGVASCEGCHDGVGANGIVCTDCHVYPTFSLSVTASPTSVPALSSSDVTLTVGQINTVRESGYNGLTPVFSPANGAAVTLSGAGVSTSGTTDAAGIVTKSVNPTGTGTIDVAATLTGFNNGTTTITSNSAEDTTPPVITMLGSTPIDIVVGSVYIDAGATALDNKDGNLTSAIVTVNSVNTSVIGNYTVTYNVVDAAGNHAVEKVRNVNVVAVIVDTIPPVITMLGSTPIDIVVGSSYLDAGATALDNKDGNLTSAIVTVNSVNTSVIGNYTVTYNVVDAAGNHAVEKVRTVNVVAAPTPAEHYILTFIVTDNVTGKPIKEAKVSIDGSKKETNRSGMVVFKKVSPGNQSYSVKSEHYKIFKGSIEVASNMTISVTLTPSKKHHDDDENDGEDGDDGDDNGGHHGGHHGGHNKQQDK